MEGRAWKQVNGVTTLYLELDGIEWGSYDPAGTLKERTIRASGTGGAVVAIHAPAGGLIRLLPNRQGSVIGWLRPDGKLGGAFMYDAYGNSPQAGAGGPQFRYAGMRFDAETGLYHTPNRAYDPQDGRWMQLDPIGIKDGLNRYAYVKNSPLMGVDPTGLACYCGTPRDDKLAEAGRQVGVGVAQSETKVDDAILIGAFAAMAAPVAIEVGAAALANPVGATQALAGLAEGVAPGAGSGTLAAAGAVGANAVGKLAGVTDDVVQAAESVTVRFGAVENQISHTFRHVEKAGFDRQTVQEAINQQLSKTGEALPGGQYSSSVLVDGTKLDYSAFKLPDGTINVGRITPPRP
ncbi:RHS repeat-associated core domain-containing protein [Asticcacaulis sp.]|uniref:RHS repeat-associated core domain-containing protein n=1 Tax=Asticcacaulis sp. TaxID=1872648 RepID=UPI002624463A|nr:RHS repeat-associated core domain-containing protein [Asticcacaulis sp.]